MKSRLGAWMAAVIGYVLSPLSWWNDLFVNLPLAYLFALPFSFLNEKLYLPAFVLGYWLTNLGGLLLLHHAGATLIHTVQEHFSWKGALISTTVYTVLIVILVLTGVLPSAGELAQRMNQ